MNKRIILFLHNIVVDSDLIAKIKVDSIPNDLSMYDIYVQWTINVLLTWSRVP